MLRYRRLSGREIVRLYVLAENTDFDSSFEWDDERVYRLQYEGEGYLAFMSRVCGVVFPDHPAPSGQILVEELNYATDVGGAKIILVLHDMHRLVRDDGDYFLGFISSWMEHCYSKTEDRLLPMYLVPDMERAQLRGGGGSLRVLQ